MPEHHGERPEKSQFKGFGSRMGDQAGELGEASFFGPSRTDKRRLSTTLPVLAAIL